MVFLFNSITSGRLLTPNGNWLSAALCDAMININKSRVTKFKIKGKYLLIDILH